MTIRRPRVSLHHPDRGIDCEDALYDRFTAIRDGRAPEDWVTLNHDACEAGWDPTEIAVALVSLDINRELAGQAKADTDAAITRAQQSAARDKPWR